jgi:hypothetical protein
MQSKRLSNGPSQFSTTETKKEGMSSSFGLPQIPPRQPTELQLTMVVPKNLQALFRMELKEKKEFKPAELYIRKEKLELVIFSTSGGLCFHANLAYRQPPRLAECPVTPVRPAKLYVNPYDLFQTFQYLRPKDEFILAINIWTEELEVVQQFFSNLEELLPTEDIEQIEKSTPKDAELIPSRFHEEFGRKYTVMEDGQRQTVTEEIQLRLPQLRGEESPFFSFQEFREALLTEYNNKNRMFGSKDPKAPETWDSKDPPDSKRPVRVALNEPMAEYLEHFMMSETFAELHFNSRDAFLMFVSNVLVTNISHVKVKIEKEFKFVFADNLMRTEFHVLTISSIRSKEVDVHMHTNGKMSNVYDRHAWVALREFVLQSTTIGGQPLTLRFLKNGIMEFKARVDEFSMEAQLSFLPKEVDIG